ncbi:hypothetical protein J2W91_001770 [Paenibacillus amylolyticus]|uniref:Uncharacterized protein n=1 Tax=Paenibacillus amylolyticus TaxID=1451 RepID=A0AAP5LNC2_PAEAM|nr:hypothetical protein [Paenibacillus amylolyticus]MDR6723318.1 hypothetical protein [Paenibacillus amylolyticus]
MSVLSTGPIENSLISGVRPTQQVTIRLVNRATADSVTVYLQGYVISTTRTLYVHEAISIAPNEVVSKNYFADLDAFEFVFETSAEGVGEVGISVWGKQASGQLVDAHRIVVHENIVKDI